MRQIVGANHEFHDSDYAAGWAERFEPTPDRLTLFNLMLTELQTRIPPNGRVVELGMGRAIWRHISSQGCPVMAALAWSLKAWVALWLPIAPRWRQRHAEEQRRLLRMDFRTFLGAFINVPCQVLTQGRRVIYRLLAWNPWQYIFFRFVDAT